MIGLGLALDIESSKTNNCYGYGQLVSQFALKGHQTDRLVLAPVLELIAFYKTINYAVNTTIPCNARLQTKEWIEIGVLYLSS